MLYKAITDYGGILHKGDIYESEMRYTLNNTQNRAILTKLDNPKESLNISVEQIENVFEECEGDVEC